MNNEPNKGPEPQDPLLINHDADGIKELDTPVPRGILVFLVVTHLFALLWWILMPTWPLVTTYTKGLLGTDQRKIVEQQMVDAAAERAPWVKVIETASFAEIQANEQLMKSGDHPRNHFAPPSASGPDPIGRPLAHAFEPDLGVWATGQQALGRKGVAWDDLI